MPVGGMLGPRPFADHGEFGSALVSLDDVDVARRAPNPWWTSFDQRVRSFPLPLGVQPPELLCFPALPEPAQRDGAHDAGQA